MNSSFETPVNPSDSTILQDGLDLLGFLSTGIAFSNSTNSMQARSPSIDLQSNLIGISQFSNISDPMIGAFPLEFFENLYVSPSWYSGSQSQNFSIWDSISSYQTIDRNLDPIFSSPTFYSQRAMTSTPFQNPETNVFGFLESILNAHPFEEQKKNTGLSEEQINGLKSSLYQENQKDGINSRMKTRNGIQKKYSSIKVKETENKSEPTCNKTCAICISDYKNGENITDLPCHHKFHKECISEWLAVKNSCPACKAKVIEVSQVAEETGSNRDLRLNSLTSSLANATQQIINLTNSLSTIQRIATQSLSSLLQRDTNLTGLNTNFAGLDFWDDLFLQGEAIENRVNMQPLSTGSTLDIQRRRERQAPTSHKRSRNRATNRRKKN